MKKRRRREGRKRKGGRRGEGEEEEGNEGGEEEGREEGEKGNGRGEEGRRRNMDSSFFQESRCQHRPWPPQPPAIGDAELSTVGMEGPEPVEGGG